MWIPMPLQAHGFYSPGTWLGDVSHCSPRCGWFFWMNPGLIHPFGSPTVLKKIKWMYTIYIYIYNCLFMYALYIYIYYTYKYICIYIISTLNSPSPVFHPTERTLGSCKLPRLLSSGAGASKFKVWGAPLNRLGPMVGGRRICREIHRNLPPET